MDWPSCRVGPSWMYMVLIQEASQAVRLYVVSRLWKNKQMRTYRSSRLVSSAISPSGSLTSWFPERSLGRQWARKAVDQRQNCETRWRRMPQMTQAECVQYVKNYAWRRLYAKLYGLDIPGAVRWDRETSFSSISWIPRRCRPAASSERCFAASCLWGERGVQRFSQISSSKWTVRQSRSEPFAEDQTRLTKFARCWANVTKETQPQALQGRNLWLAKLGTKWYT